MTKEELKNEVEDKGIKYADSLEYTISEFSEEEGYYWSQVEQAYEKGALDFAEPREKRIEELERKLEQTEKDLADYQFNYPTIKELEKENAELKEYNKYLRRKRQGGIQKQYNKVAIIKQRDEQLTKAKDLLEELYDCIPSSSADYYKETLQKVADFLKDSEVEK